MTALGRVSAPLLSNLPLQPPAFDAGAEAKAAVKSVVQNNETKLAGDIDDYVSKQVPAYRDKPLAVRFSVDEYRGPFAEFQAKKVLTVVYGFDHEGMDGTMLTVEKKYEILPNGLVSEWGASRALYSACFKEGLAPAGDAELILDIPHKKFIAQK